MLGELDRGLSADLLAADDGRIFLGFRVRVTQDEGRRGQDQQLLRSPAVFRQPALDVGEERPAGIQGAVPGEDGIRRGGREFASGVGVTGLEDDRATLRAGRHVEVAADVEMVVVHAELPGISVAQERPGLLVGHDLVVGPGVEQHPGGLEELPRPLVTLVLREKAAAPEVLAGERIPRGDDVPGRPPLRQVIEGGELPGHVVGLVERRIDRPRQSDPGGDGGQCRQDAEGVGPAHHVKVVDLPVLLAQAQTFGQEQEVELGALGDLRESAERFEFDVATRPRVAPDGGVVDAGEVRRQVDLFARLRSHAALASLSMLTHAKTPLVAVPAA